MKTEWDYTNLADAYLERPDYAASALAQLFELCQTRPGQKVCDVGAGVAHLTLHLASQGLQVTAVEPNDAMRANGMRRTAHLPNVSWVEATCHATLQEDQSMDLVTFGSSFNVADRSLTLRETHRILKSRGWFFCLWNHRNLEDPVQAGLEEVIRRFLPEYGYGVRREDQREIIESVGLFGPVQFVEGRVLHRQSKAACLKAWRSHATLQRQAGDKFAAILDAIEGYLKGLSSEDLEIPYTTRAWAAQKKA